MQQPNWQAEFDENWATIGRLLNSGVIYGKNGQMVFDEKDKNQLSAIKSFISEVESKAKEEGRREMLEGIEKDIRFGRTMQLADDPDEHWIPLSQLSRLISKLKK